MSNEIVRSTNLNLEDSDLLQSLVEVNDMSVPGITHHQLIFKFPNGYGASVVRGTFTYGGGRGLFELALLGLDGEICYAPPITDGVVGYLSPKEVIQILEDIRKL
jgi:hypothetical protein